MRHIRARVGRDASSPAQRQRGRLDPGRWAGASDVWLVDATAEGVDFSGLHLDHLTTEGSRLERCDFRGTTFEGGTFAVGSQSTFTECRFDGADLVHMDVGQARFVRCAFDQARIVDWASDAAEFLQCHFAGRLMDCRFSGRPWGMWEEPGALDPARTVNEFDGNDFREAELIGCSFVRGINIDRQQWPSRDEYVRLDNLQRRIGLARPKIEGWPEDDQRTDALTLLTVYGSLGYEEQSDLFAHRWDLGLDRTAVDRAWELLARVQP